MYHDHFGLDEPPFKITPDTRLFYEGGKRGDILEALFTPSLAVRESLKSSAKLVAAKRCCRGCWKYDSVNKWTLFT